MNKPQIIHHVDEAAWLESRKHDITSTEIGALFGINKYITKYELWHKKREGIAGDFEPHERIVWGQRLQDSIATGIAQDQGWKVKRMDEYMRIPELRIGASFDFSINEVTGPKEMTAAECLAKTDGLGILEIKNVDSLIYRDEWVINDDGSVEAPLHIEIQFQHQLAVSGRKWGYIGALVGGNRVELLLRVADNEIISAIKTKAAEFWESIDKNIEPEPDFERDADFISKLYGYAEPGKVYDATGNSQIDDLVREHKALGDAIKTAETARDAIKAQILTLIGDAEKVQGAGWSITCSIVGACPISYVRQAYRTFKPNWPRKKKETA